MTATRSVLVCGGAGYIGSHMCKRLAQAGYLPVTFDNLSTGHRCAVRWGPLEQADLLDESALRKIMSRHDFFAVMHFAARSVVAESVHDPAAYLRTNVVGTLNLLDAMRYAGSSRLVFSSTASVYGPLQYAPVDELHPVRPGNPYGVSKMLAEQSIMAYCYAYGLRAVIFRYFNAAGADSQGDIGEDHWPETHLIPNLIRAAIHAEADPVEMYGDDYETPDGTCVRDYVHVEDLCEAHLLALDYLQSNLGPHVFNLGTGCGYSVRQVIQHCRELCHGMPSFVVKPRRQGDPAMLVASAAKAARELGWQPRLELDAMLRSALQWHQRVSKP